MQTEIVLPSDVAELVEKEARRRKRSASETVCEILSEHLLPVGGPPPERGPRRIPFAGLFSDDQMVKSTEIDDYLGSHWAGDIARDRG